MISTFSSVTIIKFTNIFRDLAISKLTSEDHIIGEKNIICEIDESKFKKYENFWVVVHTDHWKGYSHLDQLNIIHRRVNHSKNRIQRGTGVHTNSIEGLWNGVKLNISTRNCSKQLLEKHLYEFMWRHKYRNNLFEAFINLLK
ncbi:Transposase, ISXO2-like domain-containing protein [Gigaspora margarita]|uniref:Transposase, ISXO2-like domain-containing protein n=1 Tax=Gigaspora margarita TaxID=4874 RepID=A0A8H4EIV7_GIGMA|nr:Transposase, ISXO2-like domain-containing protein [Gigaspora margarita]